MNVYESIVKGLQEAISNESGNGTAYTVKCTVNPAPDYDAKQIKDVRNSLGLTQIAFAEVTGVSPKAVETWEAGTNKPNGSARRLISMLQADPTILAKFEILNV
ncbi:MAG: helix-turn-helix domain-containing protein [Acutalibacteraceae bacterium]|nr:helix-turn-helix domain-containing protein [Acutalibacteraceae bacterium]